MKILPTDALIVVDPQNDFCEGGSLAVNGGNADLMNIINDLSFEFRMEDGLIVTTQDWHPKGHSSFAKTHGKNPFEVIEMPYGPQVLWPEHCVNGTKGADFHEAVEVTVIRSAAIFRKGTNKAIDSYSAFYENDKTTSVGLGPYLKSKGIKRVFVVGLAYDFCVGFTALDAVKEGFETFVVSDATAAIYAPTETGDTATDMTAALAGAGVSLITANILTGE